MEKKRINLDDRLNTLAELLGRCHLYTDIGCDHGRLGACLLQRGQVERAILTDISADSLDKARRLVRLVGLGERVEFRVCDGIPELPEVPDAYVIAGMGGELVASILSAGRDRLRGARLLLQANVALPQLREALLDIGYRITRERVVRDGRRFYVILEAIPGTADYTREELIVGPCLMRDRPELLCDYAAFRLRVAQKALAGAERGEDDENVRLLREEAELWGRWTR